MECGEQSSDLRQGGWHCQLNIDQQSRRSNQSPIHPSHRWCYRSLRADSWSSLLLWLPWHLKLLIRDSEEIDPGSTGSDSELAKSGVKFQTVNLTERESRSCERALKSTPSNPICRLARYPGHEHSARRKALEWSVKCRCRGILAYDLVQLPEEALLSTKSDESSGTALAVPRKEPHSSDVSKYCCRVSKARL